MVKAHKVTRLDSKSGVLSAVTPHPAHPSWVQETWVPAVQIEEALLGSGIICLQSSLLASGGALQRDLGSSWQAVALSSGTGLLQNVPWDRSVRDAAGSHSEISMLWSFLISP